MIQRLRNGGLERLTGFAFRDELKRNGFTLDRANNTAVLDRDGVRIVYKAFWMNLPGMNVVYSLKGIYIRPEVTAKDIVEGYS